MIEENCFRNKVTLYKLVLAVGVIVIHVFLYDIGLSVLPSFHARKDSFKI